MAQKVSPTTEQCLEVAPYEWAFRYLVDPQVPGPLDSPTQESLVQYCTVQYITIQYSTAQYSSVGRIQCLEVAPCGWANPIPHRPQIAGHWTLYFCIATIFRYLFYTSPVKCRAIKR